MTAVECRARAAHAGLLAKSNHDNVHGPAWVSSAARWMRCAYLADKAERQDVAAIHGELARAYQAMVDHAELRPTLKVKFAGQDTEPQAEPSSFKEEAGGGAA